VTDLGLFADFKKITNLQGKTLMPMSSLRIAAAVAAILGCAHAAAQEAQPIKLDIPAQRLDKALNAWAEQTGYQVMIPADDPTARERKAPKVEGTYTPEGALKVLLASSDLKYRFVGDQAVTISANAKSSSPPDKSATKSNATAETQSAQRPLDLAQSLQRENQEGTNVAKTANNGAEHLDEVTVTGSRIAANGYGDTAYKLDVYTRQQIDRSGRTELGDFLNALPQVSVSVSGSPLQNATFGGATSVSLHGLPSGSTLVLLNGQRLETSATQAVADVFDLNNLPLTAVDHIEVLPGGASAIYGADAVAGVVNIITRKPTDGFEVAANYGDSTRIDEYGSNAIAGHVWDHGSLSVIANFSRRGNLRAEDRALTANSDYTRFGGVNNNWNVCEESNFYSADGITPLPGLGNATFASVPPGYSGTPSVGEFQRTAGHLSSCGLLLGLDTLGELTRTGALIQGSLMLTPTLEVRAEIPISHITEENRLGYPVLYGIPGYSIYTVGASNPFNPFSTLVGVSAYLPVQQTDRLVTDFFRPLVKLRQTISPRLDWELSLSSASDRTRERLFNGTVDATALQRALDSSDPTTAINPFVSPVAVPLQNVDLFEDTLRSYRSRSTTLNGVVRGSPFSVGDRDVRLAAGAEYTHSLLDLNAPPASVFSASRTAYALFSEARVPIWGNSAREVVTLDLAARYDHYDDFGSHSVPQVGLEWRPTSSLLVRGSYGRSFKAPALLALHVPRFSQTNVLIDPASGQQVPVTVTSGGNPELRPATGASHSIGFVFSSERLPGLRFGVTEWRIDQEDSVQQFSAQSILDNESLFPGAVARSPSQGGQSGLVESVDASYHNYGRISVSGIDYDGVYSWALPLGQLTASFAATETYRYWAALLPGLPATSRVSVASDDMNFSPRWKGNVSLTWAMPNVDVSVSGRFIGRYLDYDGQRELGNVWLMDASARYQLHRQLFSGVLKNVSVTLAAINLFDRLPQFSSYQGGFLGYDPTQMDIRGRVVQVKLSAAL
jgi:iron complex outermembrane receptor protein